MSHANQKHQYVRHGEKVCMRRVQQEYAEDLHCYTASGDEVRRVFPPVKEQRPASQRREEYLRSLVQLGDVFLGVQPTDTVYTPYHVRKVESMAEFEENLFSPVV